MDKIWNNLINQIAGPATCNCKRKLSSNSPLPNGIAVCNCSISLMPKKPRQEPNKDKPPNTMQIAPTTFGQVEVCLLWIFKIDEGNGHHFQRASEYLVCHT